MPGFGAFINIRHSARLDEGVWIAPTREVRYNAAVNHDDGLLASSYARKLELPYAEGREAMRRAVSLLTETLRAEGEVTFGHLGIMQYCGGAVTFVPRMNSRSASAMLGFRDVAMPADESEELPKPAEIVEEATGRQIPVSRIFIRTAVCLVVLAAIAVSMLLPESRSERIDRAAVVPVERIIEKSHAPAATAAAPAEEPSEAAEAAIEVEEAPVAAENYHLIVATFKSMEDARTFMQMHPESGFDLHIVEARGMYRVSALSTSSSEKAFNMLKSKAFKEEFDQAWIWKSN